MCVAACCSVLQRVAVCCSVLQTCDRFPLLDFLKIFVAKTHTMPHLCVLQCFAGCRTVLQCIAVSCSVLQRKRPTGCLIFVCCRVCRMSQCVAVCCSVLQCVAVCSVCWVAKTRMDALSLQVSFRKRALYLVANPRKETCNKKSVVVCCSMCCSATKRVF